MTIPRNGASSPFEIMTLYTLEDSTNKLVSFEIAIPARWYATADRKTTSKEPLTVDESREETGGIMAAELTGKLCLIAGDAEFKYCW